MFSKEEKEQIAFAIEKAEHQTSGEIRVVVEKNCQTDVLEAAWSCFHQLHMHQTRLRNGVLIFIAYEAKKFAIIGDKGIHQLVPTDFWDHTKSIILEGFKRGEFAKGVIDGVNEAGVQLKKFFPRTHDDINELPNEVVEWEDKQS